MNANESIYKEEDPADALYMVVEGRVPPIERRSRALGSGSRRSVRDLGPGRRLRARAARRGARDGLALALHRDQFYDVAAGDLMLLQQVVRALAKRLRALVSERPRKRGSRAKESRSPKGSRTSSHRRRRPPHQSGRRLGQCGSRRAGPGGRRIVTLRAPMDHRAGAVPEPIPGATRFVHTEVSV
jgi:CRP-like cAMP-binding protein